MKVVQRCGKEEELRCQYQGPLKQIADKIKDQQHQLTNLGLPLTIEPHENIYDSYLSATSTDEISLRGLVNLLCLLLVCYNIRMIVISLKEHDFVLAAEVSLRLSVDPAPFCFTMPFLGDQILELRLPFRLA